MEKLTNTKRIKKINLQRLWRLEKSVGLLTGMAVLYSTVENVDYQVTNQAGEVDERMTKLFLELESVNKRQKEILEQFKLAAIADGLDSKYV